MYSHDDGSSTSTSTSSHPPGLTTITSRAPSGSVEADDDDDDDGVLGPSLCRRQRQRRRLLLGTEESESDDFRGYFDFEEAWTGRRHGHGHISSSSYSTTTSPRWSPRADQEYDDIMYKLDLGAESPSYLGTAYHYGHGGSSPVPRVPERIIEEEEEEEKVPKNYADVDCRMCLKKAVSRVRTRCCYTVFCRAHINEWLEREESKGLCPMCDKPCVLVPPPPPPLLSVSACRSKIMPSPSSSTSTISTSSTSLTLVEEEEGWWEPEAKDTWDVQGGSAAAGVKDFVREWVGGGKESTRRVASVIGMVLVLFVLLR